jgi:hypothetical protein
MRELDGRKKRFMARSQAIAQPLQERTQVTGYGLSLLPQILFMDLGSDFLFMEC